jgi:hypothetical protein
VSALAFTGEREPIVRPARADRIAITARSSTREYPRSAARKRGGEERAMLEINGG